MAILNFIKAVVVSEIFITVIGGVLVFILGQLFNEYFLKPIQEYKKIRAKVAYSLTLYANLYMNPVHPDHRNPEYDNAILETRKLAAEIDAFIELRPSGNLFIPKKSNLKSASRSLIGISNGFYYREDVTMLADKNEFKRLNICKKLRLHKCPK